MTTQILSLPPEVVSQTPGEQPKSPLMQQGAQFQQKLCALLDAEDTARLQAKNKRTQELLRLIQQEVQKVSEKIGYDYNSNDYIKRLLISDEEFEEILREKVLIGNLGAYYTELTSFYGENPKLLKKLLKEYCIEDLVYESHEGKYYERLRIEKQDFLDDYIIKIEALGKAGIKLVDFSWNDLGEKLGEEGMIQLAEALGKAGIKLVDFRWNDLGIYLGINGMIKLAEVLGKAGIKFVYFGDKELGGELLAQIAEILGKSGIKSVYFGSDKLGEHLGTEGMVQLAEALGKSGIRSVDFFGGFLGRSLGVDGMIQLAEALGRTGIKSVNFGGNELGDYLGVEGMVQLAEALGKSGIRSVDFFGDFLGRSLGVDGVDKLENKLNEYGMYYRI